MLSRSREAGVPTRILRWVVCRGVEPTPGRGMRVWRARLTRVHDCSEMSGLFAPKTPDISEQWANETSPADEASEALVRVQRPSEHGVLRLLASSQHPLNPLAI